MLLLVCVGVGGAEAVLEEAEEREEIIARVAALDIGKAELVCCARVPGGRGHGKRMQEVLTYSTMTGSLLGMVDRLGRLGVSRVVMEATSDYWRSPFYLLEAAGFEVWLVNAKDVKHLPGRPKTDLLTELAKARSGFGVRRRVGVARFTARDQRRGRSAGSVWAGGAAAGVAGGDGRCVVPVSTC